MIKIKIGNGDRETDIRFPISESDLYKKLAEIHAIDSSDKQQPVTVTGIYWPEEFSVLEGCQVNLDEMNYLAKRLDSFDDREMDQFLIEDCVYYGFESSVPQITAEMFDDMQDFDILNTLAKRMAEMSPAEQVTFKAALSAEQPQNIRGAVDIAMHLNDYELSYYSDSAASFFKDYLHHFMDSRFDSGWLDTLLTQNEGERLLKRLGAAETPYGVISARGRSLYELVPYNEPETKELASQALTSEKLDVIEVLGAKALFSNGRLLPEEIPEGLYAYDLRESDDGDGFVSIEPKVGVNHGGTVLMKEILRQDQ